MMKRILLLCIALLLSFQCTACGITDSFVSSDRASVGNQENISDSSDETPENGENTGGENTGGEKQEDGDDTAIFVVIFDTKGGSTIASQNIEKGGRVERPINPTKEEDAKYEYAFAGWYYGERKWNFETDTVNENVTLTAKWNVKSIYTEPFLPSD